MMTFEIFLLIELVIFLLLLFSKTKKKTKIEKIPEGKFDGRIIINLKDPEKDSFRLEYDGSIPDILEKDAIIFRVVKE